jgi:hypothetical protein
MKTVSGLIQETTKNWFKPHSCARETETYFEFEISLESVAFLLSSLTFLYRQHVT